MSVLGLTQNNVVLSLRAKRKQSQTSKMAIVMRKSCVFDFENSSSFGLISADPLLAGINGTDELGLASNIGGPEDPVRSATVIEDGVDELRIFEWWGTIFEWWGTIFEW